MSAATSANPAAAFYATPAARLVGAALRLAHRWSPAARDPARAAVVLHPASGEAARSCQGRARALVGDPPPLRRRRVDHLAAPRPCRPAGRASCWSTAGRAMRSSGARSATASPPRVRSGARRPAGPRPQRRRPQHPAAMGSRPLRGERPPRTLARHRRAFARCPRVGACRGARPARGAAGAGRDLAAAAPVPALVRRRAGPGEALAERMQDWIERHEGVPMEQFEPAWLGTRLVQPTLLVHDRDDRTAPFAGAERLAGAIAGARLVTLERPRPSPGAGGCERARPARRAPARRCLMVVRLRARGTPSSVPSRPPARA